MIVETRVSTQVVNTLGNDTAETVCLISVDSGRLADQEHSDWNPFTHRTPVQLIDSDQSQIRYIPQNLPDYCVM